MNQSNRSKIIGVMAAAMMLFSFLAMTPPRALGQDVGGLTYHEVNQPQRIYAFLRAADSKLSVNYWNGYQWGWADQGPGQNATMFGTPGVIAYREGTQPRQIHAFVNILNDRLWANYWNGSQWSWTSHGWPGGIIPPSTSPSAEMVGSPGVITYREGSQPQEIHAFVLGKLLGVVGTKINLFVRHKDSAGWHWGHQGRPPGVSSLHGTPGVISYREGSQSQRIYAFVRGSDGKLHLNYRKNSQWNWRVQGAPPGTAMSGSPGVVTYRDGSQSQRIYSFVNGANGKLYVNYWNGSQWGWRDQGTPPGTTVTGSPGVISYKGSFGGPREIYAFVRGANGKLYMNFWDGSGWQWEERGTPQGTTLTFSNSPEASTYRDPQNGVQRIYTFVKGTNGKLYVNYRKNSQWSWREQGTP